MGEKYYRREDIFGRVYYEKEDSYSGGHRSPILDAIGAAICMPFGFIGSGIVYGCLYWGLESGELGWLIGGFLLSLILLLIVGSSHSYLSENYSDGFWKCTNYIIFLIEAILIYIYIVSCFDIELYRFIIASIILLLCLIFGDLMDNPEISNTGIFLFYGLLVFVLIIIFEFCFEI